MVHSFLLAGVVVAGAALLTWTLVALLTARNDGNGDRRINLAWNTGALGAGDTVAVNFQYRIASTLGAVSAIPEPKARAAVLPAAALGFVVLRRRLPVQ